MKKNPRNFRFITLTMEIPDRTKPYSQKSHNNCYTTGKLHVRKPKLMEILPDFFFKSVEIRLLFSCPLEFRRSSIFSRRKVAGEITSCQGLPSQDLPT